MKLTMTAFSVGLGLLVCLTIATVMGQNPIELLEILFRGSLGSLSAIGYTLFYATPLIFTGLSVAVAFHCGLFNIGAEGQLYMGALALTCVGILVPQCRLAPLVGILAAMAGGALWGAIAGVLKAYRGSHEVIVTIMLNFISYAVVGFAILHVFKNPASQNPESAPLGDGFSIPGITFLSPLNSSFLIALLAAFGVWFLLFRTSWGFEMRLTGSKPETALRTGISVKRRMIEAMALSGALAGLVAVNEIMGFSHKFRDQFSIGYGFIGIAVALLGRTRPLGVVLAAILFGALQKGSLELEL
jgi:simple sugar transport system permease protein